MAAWTHDSDPSLFWLFSSFVASLLLIHPTLASLHLHLSMTLTLHVFVRQKVGRGKHKPKQLLLTRFLCLLLYCTFCKGASESNSKFLILRYIIEVEIQIKICCFFNTSPHLLTHFFISSGKKSFRLCLQPGWRCFIDLVITPESLFS